MHTVRWHGEAAEREGHVLFKWDVSNGYSETMRLACLRVLKGQASLRHLEWFVFQLFGARYGLVSSGELFGGAEEGVA